MLTQRYPPAAGYRAAADPAESQTFYTILPFLLYTEVYSKYSLYHPFMCTFLHLQNSI